jgi:hypothetical protein
MWQIPETGFAEKYLASHRMALHRISTAYSAKAKIPGNKGQFKAPNVNFFDFWASF